MKITRRQLRHLIKEEIGLLTEGQSLGEMLRDDLTSFDIVGDPDRDVFSNSKHDMIEIVCELRDKNDNDGLEDVRSGWLNTINTHTRSDGVKLNDLTRSAARAALKKVFKTHCS